MANPFLNGTKDYDVETAILLEKAIVTDIGKAVAFTNEKKQVFVNTDDNLYKILPNYNEDMLKWLLWHEEYHCLLSHASRFFRYLNELSEETLKHKFYVTKDEVNIIMDILVHDILASKFPELVPTAIENLAQFRDRNSLKYTFKTNTLEKMLDEYKEFKTAPEKEDDTKDDTTDTEDTTEDTDESEDMGSKKMRKDESKTGRESATPTPTTPKDTEDEEDEQDTAPSESEDEDTPSGDESEQEESTPGGHHDETDWSQLEKIDTNEFIDDEDSQKLTRAVEKVRKQKLKLMKLTQTLNGLASTKRTRSYKMPSTIHTGGNVILKGRTPGFAKLYLVFDASGSMDYELDTFRKVITEAIPQAKQCECEWFSGYPKGGNWSSIKHLNYDKKYHSRSCIDYYKGKYSDFINITASSGYGDDGDRVIELCALAEEKGYTPIGVTDGGGCLRYPETLKKLKRTVLIGKDYHDSWFKKVKSINPNVQTIVI